MKSPLPEKYSPVVSPYITGDEYLKPSHDAFKYPRKVGNKLNFSMRPDVGLDPFAENTSLDDYGNQIAFDTNSWTAYGCHYCSKVLQDAYSLKMHMRIHTGEKPFACAMCDYKSTQMGNLQRHAINRHPTNLDYIESLKINRK